MKGILDSIKLWMLKIADNLPIQFPAQYEILRTLRSCKRVTLQGCYTLSYSLLFLAFTIQWNPKHPSFVRTWLFCNYHIVILLSMKNLKCKTASLSLGIFLGTHLLLLISVGILDEFAWDRMYIFKTSRNCYKLKR